MNPRFRLPSFVLCAVFVVSGLGFIASAIALVVASPTYSLIDYEIGTLLISAFLMFATIGASAALGRREGNRP